MSDLLSILGLNEIDQDAETVQSMINDLMGFQRSNKLRERYYEGKNRAKNLNIAVPPSLRSAINSAVGWGGIQVDSLVERLDFQGWETDVPCPELDYAYSENSVELIALKVMTDAVVYGTSFIAVSAGDQSEGEPEVLITAESPMTMTATLNERTGRVDQAVKVKTGPLGNITGATLYTKNFTASYVESNGRYVEDDRDDHNLGRCPIVRFVNKPRSADAFGRSEITRASMSFIDSAVRTLLGLEVHREFFSSPQRYILGADEDLFKDENGEPIPAWEAYLGRYLAIAGQADDNGDKENPSVGQFTVQSPDSYTTILKTYSQQMAAESALPVGFFGLVQDNPSSADAIRMSEARLVKRAKLRWVSFGPAWKEVARLVGAFTDVDPSVLRTVTPIWGNPSTLTLASQADAVLKFISSGAVLPDSSFIHDTMDLNQRQRKVLKAELEAAKVQDRAQAILAGIGVAAEQARTNPAVAAANAQTKEVKADDNQPTDES